MTKIKRGFASDNNAGVHPRVWDALRSAGHGHAVAIGCAETAHINVDECGAPERFTGCKLIDLQTPDGKLTPEQVEPLLARLGDQHHVQPRVVSVSQPT